MPTLQHRVIAVVCTAVLVLAGTDIGARDPVYGPESVVVIANSSMPESMEVARTYMQMRSIPDEHLILVKTSTAESISRKTYLETLHNPILSELLERKLVDAFPGPPDVLGRKTASIFKLRIRYLVLCHGIPLRIEETASGENSVDEPLLKQYFALSNPALIDTFSSGRMQRNEASVDGELSLLLERGTPLRGFVPNPLHTNGNREVLTDVLRVTRLDGPSVDAVLRMLNSSRNGEVSGLRGRAYVDEDGRTGAYQIGNTWMANSAKLFKNLGFDISHDTAQSTFSPTARFDAPVLYAGWYAWDCDGPFTLPGFRFPDGAVAAHLHSFSASKIRSSDKGWVGPFVDRGVACTVGNVSEPYLNLTHKFDAFFEALCWGWNFADAAYYALPGLSWQAVAVGDPLYRPFARSLEDQLETIGEPSRILQDQYLVIRQAQLLEASGKDAEALALLEKQFHKVPGPALALAKARLYRKQELLDKAGTSLEFVQHMESMDAGSWGLMAEIADELGSLGKHSAAIKIYANLLEQKMPEGILKGFLNKGILLAQNSGNPEIAGKWRDRLEMLGGS